MANNLPCSPKAAPKVIIYGAFKGMGDLLCAAPVIASELSSGAEVKLLVFPNTPLSSIVKLLDFGSSRHNLQLIELPVGSRHRGLASFIRQMKGLRTEFVWISPHASRQASS